jgi:Tol biopolymer transport system component
VPFLGGISATWVSFSKSGRSVAYIDYSNKTVWRANSDGSEQKQITFASLEAEGLSWSPDEKWLAFRARTPGKNWMVHLVPAQGGEIQMMLPGEREQGIPTWSADGTRIAFGDVPPVFAHPLGTESIHVFDLKTHKLSELPGSKGLWTVRWSPDGKSLAALTIKGQRLKIYDFGTKKWWLTNAHDVNNLNWSRDGKYIYFDIIGEAFCRVSMADGHVDQLASLRAYPNLAYGWSGITSDDSPLILRSLGASEIYSLKLEYR